MMIDQDRRPPSSDRMTEDCLKTSDRPRIDHLVDLHYMPLFIGRFPIYDAVSPPILHHYGRLVGA